MSTNIRMKLIMTRGKSTEDHGEWVHFSPWGWSFTVATQNETDWDQLSTFQPLQDGVTQNETVRARWGWSLVVATQNETDWDQLSPSLATAKYGHSKLVHFSPVKTHRDQMSPQVAHRVPFRSRSVCGELGTNLAKYSKPEGFYYCEPARLWWPICSRIQID